MDTPTQDIPKVEAIYTTEDIIKQVESSGINLGDDPVKRVDTFIAHGLLPQPKNGRFASWVVQRVIAIQNQLMEGKSITELEAEVKKERRRFLNQVTDLNSMVKLYQKFSSNSMFMLASSLLLIFISLGFVANMLAPGNPVIVAGKNTVKKAMETGGDIAKRAVSPVGKTLVMIIQTSKPEDSKSADPLGLTNLEIDTPVIPDNLVQIDNNGNLIIKGKISALDFSGNGENLTDLLWSSITERPKVLSAIDGIEADEENVDLLEGAGISILSNDSLNTITINATDTGSSQFIFKNIAVPGQNTLVADSNSDTLTFIAGSNLAITTDSTSDSLTFSITGTVSNADTLDLLDSSQFLRSDTSDSFTSGTLTTNAGTTLAINGSLALPATGISGAGAGSGLDADLLDSLNSTAFARLANNESVSGRWTFAGTGGVPLLVQPSSAVAGDHFQVLDSVGTNLFRVGELGSIYANAHIYTGGTIRLGNDGTLYNINAITARGATTITDDVTIGGADSNYDWLTMTRFGDANIITQTKSSNRIVLEGAYWNGSSSQTVSMQMLNIVTSTVPAYRISFMDNGSVERAFIDNSGNASFSGTLSVTGGTISSNASQLILQAAGANADVVVQGGLCIRDATACPDVAAGGLQVDTAGGVGDDSGDVFDVAEIYDAAQPVSQGELVSAAGNQMVKKTSSEYDPGVIGVASSHPAALIDQGTFKVGVNPSEFNPNKPWVALAGRVPTKVSTENGSIEPGDPLTSSSTAGVAMKATKSGPIVGKALEAFTGGIEVTNGQEGQDGGNPSNSSDPSQPSSPSFGKIMVFVTTSWYVAGLDAGSSISDLSNITNLNVENLTSNIVNAQILFVGDTEISIAKNGSLKIEGDVEIGGKIIAEKIDISKSRTESNQITDASAGKHTIPAGNTEIVIETSVVTKDSLIFVTSTTTTDKVLSANTIIEGKNFTVEIASPDTKDIRFNWWVIN